MGGLWAGIPSDRVVAVVACLDTGRVQTGSGYLVSGRGVLTAGHCTVDKKTGRPARSLRVIRRSDGAEAPATPSVAASDVALLMVAEDAVWPVLADLEPPRFGRVDRSWSGELRDCQAVGFPLWQFNPSDRQRNAAELHGTIRVTEDSESGYLVLRDPLLDGVAATAAADDQAAGSPWGGLSGALVFYQGTALGVVVEHHPRQGPSAIRILPVERFGAVAAALGLPSADELPLVGGRPLTGLATPEEFRTDVASLLQKLDDAACRANLPAYLPPGADVTRMARMVRVVGKVRRPSGGADSGTPLRGTSRERIYALPAERDDRAGVPPQPWEQVAGAHQRVVVLADPGMGKSWLVRTETHRLVQAGLASLAGSPTVPDDVVIPIPIRADILAAAPGQTLAEAVSAYLVTEGLLSARSTVPMQEQIIGGGVVLLIDALDEVPRDSPAPNVQPPGRRLEDLLRQWVRVCPGAARCVVTTRLAGYIGPPVPEAHEVELLPFSIDDARAAVRAWNLPEPAAGRVDALLADPAVAGMARIPLMLALICSLTAESRSQQDLPVNRSGLYEAVLWQFLSGAHRAADRGSTTSVTSPIERQNLLQILTHVAITFATTDRGWVDRMPHADLTAAIHSAGDAQADLGGSAATVIARLADQAGVLVPAGNPVAGEPAYMFLHRTMAEYLVARHLRDLPRSRRMRIVEDHQWFDPDWAEVFPMLGALLASEHPTEAQALVTHFLTQRPDPLHRAFHMALRILGEHPDPDRLLPAALARGVSRRTISLLKRLVTLGPLLRILTAAPAWPTVITDALTGLLGDKDDRSLFVIATLGDKDWTAQDGAILALRGRQNPAVTQALLGLLGNEDWEVRYRATRALAGRQDPAVTQALLGLLGDQQWIVRAAAAQDLTGRQDPGVTQALLGALGDQQQSVRADAAQALAGRQDPGVTQALLGALGDQDWLVRMAAAQGLAGRQDPGVTQALLGALGDQQQDVRAAAAQGLAGRQDPGVIETLLGLLGDTDGDVRADAAKVLAGRQDPGVTQALLGMLGDKHWTARRAGAAQGLAGRQDPGVTQALLGMLHDDDAPVRAAATQSLAGRQDPEVTQALLGMLHDDDAPVRAAATQSLAGRQDPEVTQALLGMLHDDKAPVRGAATLALGTCLHPKVSQALLSMLGDKDEEVQWRATLALGIRLGIRPDPKVTQALLKMLGDKDEFVRDNAVEALAERAEPPILDRVCERSLRVLAQRPRDSMYGLADFVADRDYLMLPAEARPQIRRRLGKLTWKVGLPRLPDRE